MRPPLAAACREGKLHANPFQGDCADCIANSCPADINGDCAVNVVDLVAVLTNWS